MVAYCGAGFADGPKLGERGEVLNVDVGRDRWILVPPTVPDARPRVRVLVRWTEAGEAWVATSEVERVTD